MKEFKIAVQTDGPDGSQNFRDEHRDDVFRYPRSVKMKPSKSLDLAFEKGINMFDTADAYGLGKSEEIVGKAIKNKRHSVVLATKIGHRRAAAPTIPACPASILSRQLKPA